MGLLLLLFIAVPAIELALLIEVGSRIGTLDTLALIFLTGALGASVARYQGFQVLGQIQREMAAGHLPGEALVDGAIILVAAALLITPGILTDAAGFLALIPATRTLFKRFARRWFQTRVREGRVYVRTGFDDNGPIYDVTPEDGPSDRDRLPRD